MLRRSLYPLILILAAALMGITFLVSTASPAQASDKIVVNVTGQLTQVSGPDLGPGFVLKVGGHAEGTADDLSGWATDVQVKGNAAGAAGTRGSYCIASVDGGLVGSVVTLEGALTFTNSTLPLVGLEVVLIADASTGEITYVFDAGGVLFGTPFVLSGTGIVHITHQ